MARPKTIITDEAIDTQPEPVNTTSEQIEPAKVERNLTKAEIMKEALSKQPKVSIYIPLEKGESRNSVETVILNGYRLNIKKGEYVEVPKQIADIIKDSYKQTERAYQKALEQTSEDQRVVLDNSN